MHVVYKYLIVVVLLILTGCHSSPSFDWNSQPHLGEVPPVMGKWFPPVVKTVSIDPIIYNASDDTGPIPDIGNAYLDQTKIVLNEVIPYFKQFGIEYSMVPDNSDITVKFYYGFWATGRSTSGTTILSEGKSVSSVFLPPKTTANYTGLTEVSLTNKHYEKCVVWINVYPYEDFKQQQLNNKDPRVKMDWIKSGNTFVEKIGWHEMAHTIGLNDDPTGTKAGLMVYHNMSARPSQNEIDIIKWLYSTK